MAEIGSGSGSSYPGALDTNSSLEVNSPNVGKTKVRAEVPNDLASALIAVQTELGINPAGTLVDLVSFLQVEHGTDGTHLNNLVALLAGIQTFTGAKTFNGSTTLGALAGAGWPSFSATMGAGQSILHNTMTKVRFDMEDFDTNNDYDAITNYRFTPTVAGKYLLTTQVMSGGAGDGNYITVLLAKNNVTYSEVREYSSNAGNTITGIVSVVVDANGLGDYFEVFFFQNTGAPMGIQSSSRFTRFTGSRIG